MCGSEQSEKTYARYDGTHCVLCVYERVFVCVDCSKKVTEKDKSGEMCLLFCEDARNVEKG